MLDNGFLCKRNLFHRFFTAWDKYTSLWKEHTHTQHTHTYIHTLYFITSLLRFPKHHFSYACIFLSWYLLRLLSLSVNLRWKIKSRSWGTEHWETSNLSSTILYNQDRKALKSWGRVFLVSRQNFLCNSVHWVMHAKRWCYHEECFLCVREKNQAIDIPEHPLHASFWIYWNKLTGWEEPYKHAQHLPLGWWVRYTSI